jgi:hypothetical protein
MNQLTEWSSNTCVRHLRVIGDVAKHGGVGIAHGGVIEDGADIDVSEHTR